MHLSSRTDIEAPVDFVYGALQDFEAWERAALRRGAEVTRSDRLRAPGIGMAWDLRFRFRGKTREVAVKLTGQEPEAKLAFAGDGRLLSGDLSLELMALSPKRTRLVLHVGVVPKTMGARLFLQSARLAKGRIQNRLNKRLEQYALELEQRFAGTPRR